MADGLMVALGAVPGAWLRFRVVNHFEPMVPRKHWATLAVNVGACFLLGLITALLRGCGGDQRLSLLICTGFLGSLSTFSTVMVELLQAWLSHQRRQTCALVLASVALGVAALMLGQRLGGLIAMALAAHKLRFELRELLLVAIGAMPGALLRWQAGVQLGPWLGSAGADLLVNVVGSFVLGFLAGPIPRRTGLLLLVGIGFCGSLTTFSSWVLDVVTLLERSRPIAAGGLVLVSLVLGLAAAGLGLAISRLLYRRTRG